MLQRNIHQSDASEDREPPDTGFRERSRIAEGKYQDLHQRAQLLISRLAALRETSEVLLQRAQEARSQSAAELAAGSSQQTPNIRWSRQRAALEPDDRELKHLKQAAVVTYAAAAPQRQSRLDPLLRLLPLPIYQKIVASEKRSGQAIARNGTGIAPPTRESRVAAGKTRHAAG